jgi:hypothetical protein
MGDLFFALGDIYHNKNRFMRVFHAFCLYVVVIFMAKAVYTYNAYDPHIRSRIFLSIVNGSGTRVTARTLGIARTPLPMR